MGKGSSQRPGDDDKFRREWDRIFGRKEKELRCRGSYLLGTACGRCARCEEERQRMTGK